MKLFKIFFHLLYDIGTGLNMGRVRLCNCREYSVIRWQEAPLDPSLWGDDHATGKVLKLSFGDNLRGNNCKDVREDCSHIIILDSSSRTKRCMFFSFCIYQCFFFLFIEWHILISLRTQINIFSSLHKCINVV